MRPRLIVGLQNFADTARADPWSRLLDVAAAADDAGVDCVSVVDHVALGGDLSGYPYGAFPGGVDADWLEPLTTLAAIGGRTRNVRLFTGILIAPLRPAALLAKTVATLDQLTDGRVDLGVGTGWLPKEYEAVGLDFATRGALLDRTLAVCSTLWEHGSGDIRVGEVDVADVHCHPLPIQRPGVPLWVGGELHPRNLRRIVEFGSGWIPSPPTGLADATEGARVVRDALVAAGRDPSSVRIRMTLPFARDPDGGPADILRAVEAVPRFVEAGATDIFVNLSSYVKEADKVQAFFEALVPRFHELGSS